MQNGDGSFGSFDEEAIRRLRPRYDIRIGGYLHTTHVSVWALTAMSSRGRTTAPP